MTILDGSTQTVGFEAMPRYCDAFFEPFGALLGPEDAGATIELINRGRTEVPVFLGQAIVPQTALLDVNSTNLGPEVSVVLYSRHDQTFMFDGRPQHRITARINPLVFELHSHALLQDRPPQYYEDVRAMRNLSLSWGLLQLIQRTPEEDIRRYYR